MKLIIVGYGRMGHEIENVALTKGHTIVATVDPFSPQASHKDLASALKIDADAVIEFSLKDGVLTNAELYRLNDIPAVVGTTGWDTASFATTYPEKASGFLWGSNYSIGAQLFIQLAAKATALIDKIPEYDPFLYEIHHNQKIDSPSGTALSAAKKILENSSHKKRIATERLDRRIDPDELHVASVRGGAVTGTHTLTFDSSFDSITISHVAKNRNGLATGAVLAAEWIVTKKIKGFHFVDEFMEDYFK